MIRAAGFKRLSTGIFSSIISFNELIMSPLSSEHNIEKLTLMPTLTPSLNRFIEPISTPMADPITHPKNPVIMISGILLPKSTFKILFK